MTLFNVNSDSTVLKTELYKLATASTDPVISLVDSEGGKSRIVSRALCEVREACGGGVEVCVSGDGPLTYEHLLAILESLTS